MQKNNDKILINLQLHKNKMSREEEKQNEQKLSYKKIIGITLKYSFLRKNRYKLSISIFDTHKKTQPKLGFY